MSRRLVKYINAKYVEMLLRSKKLAVVNWFVAASQ